jgi:hypothetical protein
MAEATGVVIEICMKYPIYVPSSRTKGGVSFPKTGSWKSQIPEAPKIIGWPGSGAI